MKFKKEILAIILIICMLFTISAISAADSTTDAVSVANESVKMVNVANDNSLGMNNDVERLGDGETVGTFADLSGNISNPSGNTVYLNNDYTYDESSDTITTGIVISTANLVIDGQGHTIDAKNKTRFFSINKVSGVTIKNIIFKNGYSSNGVGAVYGYYSENFIIENCTFISNQGTVGAIRMVYAANSIIKNCTFFNNKGSNYGAIEWAYNEGYITECIFINNLGNTAGSIFWSVYNGDGNISNSIFINNIGTNDIFYDNQYASYYGNTLYADYNWWGHTIDNYESSAPKVNNALTINNYYILDMSLDEDSHKSTVSLNNLYQNGAITTSYSNYALPNIKFNVKSTGTYVDVDSVVLGRSGVETFTYTSADAYSITISNTTCELTRAVKAAFISLNNQILDKDELTLNYDYEYDSAKDSSLTNGIEFAKDMTIDGQGHIIDAKGLTNIFYFDDSSESYSLTLKNIVFKNAISTNGAAVYFKGNKIEIINCTFIYNNANSQGDAVYIENAGNNNLIQKSIFINNEGSGSVVYFNSDSNGLLTVENSIFVNNSAINIVKNNGIVVADYNWWGNNATNYNTNLANLDNGISVNKWYYLNMSVDNAQRTYEISLDNLNDGSSNEYNLPIIALTVNPTNASTSQQVNLNQEGKSAGTFVFKYFTGNITAYYETAEITNALQFIDDGSFGCLQEIINFVPADYVLNLTQDVVYSDNDNIASGIVINKKITINGNGHVIDAKGKSRIFILEKKADETALNNISFINSNSDYGAAVQIVYACYDVTIENCNFTNNTATSGGAIYCIGDNCYIRNCNFTNNTASLSGGAIQYYHDSACYIRECCFINNSVGTGGLGGGAIYVEDGGIGVYDSIFINNSAKGKFGAAIYTPNVADISKSIFLDNEGNNVIYGTDSMTVSYVWFGNNATTFDVRPSISSGALVLSWYFLNISSPAKGHAIISLNNLYNSQANGENPITYGASYDLPKINLKIENTNLTIQDNFTIEGSGIADVTYKLNEETGLLKVKQFSDIASLKLQMGDFDILQKLINEKDDVIELTRNYTYGIHDDITDGILIDKKITINGNGSIDAKGKSRIFYVTGGEVVINNVTLINGKADEGAAIYWNGEDGTLKSSIIVNNTGNSAIYWASTGGDINNCILLNNSAKNIISVQSDLKADNNWFGNNASNHNTNIANVEGVTLNNWYFLDIELTSSNAKITLNNLYKVADDEVETNAVNELPDVDLTLTGENITVQDNVIIIKGSSNIQITPEYKDLYLIASYMDTSYNKTMSFIEGDFAILQNLITEVSNNGGGIIELNRNYTYIIGVDTITTGISINHANIIINGNGNVINANGKSRIFNVGSKATNLTINNITFINGHVVGDGGAIEWNGADDGIIANSSFKNNSASNGGAINWLKGKDLIISYSYFIQNSAVYAGAIYLTNSYSETITIVNSTFSNNLVTSQGGVIKGYGTANLVMDKSKFFNNSAYDGSPSLGGVIYWQAGNLLINNSCLTNNFVNAKSNYGRGGVVYLFSGTLTINNSTFTNNSAYTRSTSTSYSAGGGVIFKYGGTLNITNSTFTSNSISAYSSRNAQGAVIYWGDGEGTIDNSTFINNHAKTSGGAIYGTKSTSNAKIMNSIFINNTYSSANLLEVIRRYSSGTFTFENNWFGNTGDDKTTGVPSGTGITVNNFLYLDANHDDYMIVGKDSNVQLVFKQNTNDEVYDSSKLPKLNLTLSSVNGELNKNHASLDENILFNANQVGSASITGETLGKSVTIPLEARYLSKIITEESIEIPVGNNMVIIASLVDEQSNPITGDLRLVGDNNDEIIETMANAIRGIKDGTSSFNITFAGDETYASAKVTVSVTVKYLTDTSLSVDNATPKYGDEITLTPDIKYGVVDATFGTIIYDSDIDEGTVVYYIGDDAISGELAYNAPFTWAVNRAGEYNITAKYSGSDKYFASERNITITASKADTTATVEVTSVTYPGEVTITVTSIVSGEYTINVNGTEIKVTIPDGETSAQTTHKFGANSYSANITGTPYSDNYNILIQNDTFMVSPKENPVTIEIAENNYLPGSITVEVTGGVKGNYLVTLSNGQTVEVEVASDGATGSSDLHVAAGENYEATLSLDNSNYTTTAPQVTFNVFKTDNAITIESAGATYPNKVTVTVTAHIAGTYKVKINDTLSHEFVISQDDGSDSFEVLLNANSYSPELVNYQSEDYKEIVTSQGFVVSKGSNTVDVKVNENNYLPGAVTVNVEASVAGVYTVTIGSDKSVDVTVDETTKKGSNTIMLPEGNDYVATTTFADTDNYDVTINSATFNVIKSNNAITISSAGATYPDMTTITLTAQIAGTYNVKINDTLTHSFVVSTDGGSDSYEVLLDANVYAPELVGYEHDNYTAVVTSSGFEVVKGTNTITISSDGATYPNKVTVKVEATVPDTYAVSINNGAYSVNVVVDSSGSGTTEILLPAGENYELSTSWANDNYNVVASANKFNVEKGEIHVRMIIPTPVEFGTDVTGTVIADVAGTYFVSIPGKEAIPVVITGTQNTFNLGVLDVSPYTATVSIGESDNYTTQSNTTDFEVKAQLTPFSADSDKSEYLYGDSITLSYGDLPNGATGTVVFKFADETPITTLTVGDTSEYVIPEILDVKQYTIIVNYISDNPNYDSREQTISFEVKQAENRITVIVTPSTYPDDVIIRLNATVAGTYIIDINGTDYDVIANDTTGRSVKLAAGDYYANITYSALNYYGTTTNDTFTVTKGEINAVIDVPDIILPGDVTVKISNGVEGKYHVIINETYSLDIDVGVDGTGEGSITLPAGVGYWANAKFEDEKNYTNKIKNDTFDVNKSDLEAVVEVADIFLPGDVTVKISNGVKGKYHVIINETYSLDIDVGVDGTGEGLITLPAGVNYWANATFEDDANYTNKIKNDTFNVNKSVNNIAVIVASVDYPNDVIVKVTADIDGIYKVKVGDKTYDITANDPRGISISNLAAKEYTANVTGYSSPYYAPNITNATFTVRKAFNIVAVSVDDVTLPGDVRVKVTATVSGSYTININGTDVVVNVGEDREGSNTVHLEAGKNYNATSAFENENYTTKVIPAIFDVTKSDLNAVVEVQDKTLPGQTTVRITDAVKGRYHVIINETYSLDIDVGDDGTGEGSIALPAGVDYWANATFEDEANYANRIKNATFDVNKAENNITVVVKNIGGLEVNVKVIADIDGIYKVDINSTIKEIVANGNGINLKLAAGDYYANITDYVNETYIGIVDNAKFTIDKVSAGITPDEFGNVSVNNNKEIILNNVPEDAEVTYSSSDESVAVVDDNGNVTGIKSGKVTVTVNVTGSANYSDDVINVTVVVLKTSADITVEELGSIDAEQTKTIVFNPNGFDGTITFKSNDTDVATVNSTTGEVTGIKGGKALITLNATGSEKYEDYIRSINVTVNRISAEISIEELGSIDAKANKTAVVHKPDDYDGVITFISSDESIATVDENGVITAIKAGSLNITVVSRDSQKYNDSEANYSLKVNRIPFNLSSDDVVIIIGDIQQINVNTTGYDGVITFSSNNSDVAYVMEKTGEVMGISNGTATVTIKAAKSDVYLENTTEIKVYVNKIPSIIIVDASVELKVGGTHEIIAVVDGSGSTEFNYTSFDPSIATVDSDGKVTALKEGIVNITILFAGDDDYLANETNITVSVSKNSLDMEVDEDSIEINAEESQNIEFIKFDIGEYDGNITYISSDSSIATVDSDGKITGIKSGNVTITITATNSSVYEDNATQVTVTVNKISAGIKTDENLKVNATDSQTIVVVKPDDYDGKITFESNDTSVVSVDEKGVITAHKGGKAIITVNATGSEKYDDDLVVITVDVEKLTSDITLDVSDVTAGEDLVAIVTIPSEGIINITITQGSKVIKTENVSADRYYKYVNDDLCVETYNITAKFYGNDQYKSNEITKQFTVKPIYNFEFDVKVEDTVIGQTANVTITLPSGATGKVRIGTQEFDIPSVVTLPVQTVAGQNNVTVEYVPDESSPYASSQVIAYYNVAKKDSEAKISISDDIKAGDEATITVDTYAGANITVYVDGEKQAVKDNKVTLTAAAGTHNVIVNVAESDEYQAITANATFKVSKKTPAFTINGTNAKVGEKSVININITDSATGNVIVNVNGTEYSINLADARSIEVKLDNVGKYSVSAKYLGDEIFDSADSNAVTIEAIEKTSSNIKVEIPQNIKVGDKIVINVTSDNADLTVLINGTPQMIIDGKVEYEVTSAESYPVVVIAGETPEFSPEIYLNAFTADKKQSSVEISIPQDIRVGDKVVINVTSDNDDLTVLINGSNQTVKEGKVEYEVTAAGSYPVVVIAGETKEYMAEEYSTAFTADKNPASVEIILPEDIKIGSEIEIAVKSYDGAEIKVTVDGKSQTLTDSRFVIKATAGTHTIIATVDENDKYLGVTANATFTVDKLDSTVTVNATDVKVGEKATVTVAVTANATGIVIVNVDGTEYSIELENATSIDVLMNAKGKYNVTAKYLGDDVFNPSVSGTVTIEVTEKDTPAVNVEIPQIKAGEDANITVSIPNATGSLFIIVDGAAKEIELDENGTATYAIENMKAGNHTVTVIYPGDENNAMTVDSQAFSIDKQTSDVNVTVSDIELGKDSEISVSIPNATGNVSIIIDGVETTVPLDENGNANYTVPSLAAENHSIVVVYPGDETHAPAVIAKQINATASESEIKDIVVSGDGKITGVLVDGTGKGMANQNISYKINGVSGSTTTNDKGQFTINASSNSVVEIEYGGANNTLPTNASITLNDLTPARVATQIIGNNYTQPAIEYDFGERGGYFKVRLLDVNGKAIANRTVYIGYNGKTLERTTDGKGYASVQINLKDANRLTFAVAFLGDEQYESSMSVYLITITKKPVTITAPAKSYKASAKTKKYTVSLKTIKGADGKTYFSAGKKVSMKLNGKTYTAKTNDKGQATFKITLTKRGKFTALVSYAGTTTYEEASVKTKITIK